MLTIRDTLGTLGSESLGQGGRVQQGREDTSKHLDSAGASQITLQTVDLLKMVGDAKNVLEPGFGELPS